MYDTGGTQSICQLTPVDYDISARLGWLKAEVARAEQRRQTARREREERQALSMLNPLTTSEAFGWFGLFLGLFPPAAIFCRIFGGVISQEQYGLGMLLVCLLMNAVCCAVGRAMGARLGKSIADTRKRHWLLMLLAALLFGVLWGLITGAAGGAVFVIIGSIVGVACAVPVGALAFVLFTTLHRLLSRGGMIEERQLWPLAFGVPCVIAAAILGM